MISYLYNGLNLKRRTRISNYVPTKRQNIIVFTFLPDYFRSEHGIRFSF